MSARDITEPPGTNDRDKRRLKNGVIIYAIIEAAVLVPLLLYLIFQK